MPASLTYPGVYIEELSSGVHTITGVATSIAAFIGWANQGPVDEAVLVESWSDFETQFGGLTTNSVTGTPNYLGYAVNQFFANGGQQAYIVRVVWDGTLQAAPNSTPVSCATASTMLYGAGSSVITASFGGASASTTLLVSTGTLQSIAVTATSLTIQGNPEVLPTLTQQFKAMGTFSDGSTQDVTGGVNWNSASTGVATINTGPGLATAVSAGTTVITAKLGAVSGSATLTVTAATLTSISVTPANQTISEGMTLPFVATGTYSDGSTQDLTSSVTWPPTPAGSVASISSGGVAEASGVGAASVGTPFTITASLGAVTGNTALTVSPLALSSISLTPANATIKEGMTVQFTAVGNYPDGSTQNLTSSVTWPQTAAGSPATISTGGLATAVAVGTGAGTVVNIDASFGGITGATSLTVSPLALSTISITPANPTVAAGVTQQLKASGTYSDGSTQDLTAAVAWTPATGTVATVASGGLATAIAVGLPVQVAAAFGGVTGNTTLTVGPAVLTALTITPANPMITNGMTQQFTVAGTYTNNMPQVLTGSATWTSATMSVATIISSPGQPTNGLATAVGGRGNLSLWAANPGAWGNTVQVSVTVPSGNPTRFGLQVSLVQPNGSASVVENWVNLSILSTDQRYVGTVIDNNSQYITLVNPLSNSNAPTPPTGTPSATTSPTGFSGGLDGSILTPATDQNFELAIGPDPSPTSSNDFGLRLLDRVSIFNLLCVPGETDAPTISLLQAYCVLKRAFFIVDCPPSGASFAQLNASGPAGTNDSGGLLIGPNSINSAYYYPWVQAPDPLFGNLPAYFPPCGFVAGIYAGTDASRGVWKAPAGIDAGFTGVSGLQFNLTDPENGQLNIQAINCLRQFKLYGNVVWGARTLQGNDQVGSEWKYVPIRRLALFLESSLYDGTQWVVFEPNDEPLWGQIRLNVGSFMQGLFLQGAFQGSSPQQAYFVKCDSENNPQASIDQGIVNILVGFAPLYPAEFVVIQIQQIAGQLQS